MKKTIKFVSSLALALALVVTAVGCGVAYADMNHRSEKDAIVFTPVEVGVHDETTAISTDEAVSAAQKATGLADAENVHIERDDGKYEVTLRDGNTEYEVDISIADGAVLEIDRDWDNDPDDDRDDDDWDDWDDRDDDRDDDDDRGDNDNCDD